MKKILIIGSNHEAALENIFRNNLLKLNWSCEILPIQNIFLEFYNKSFFNKICFRLGFTSILKKLQGVILREVIDFKPDIVWIFKGMEVKPVTLKKIKKYKITLINYNPDNPFIFSSYGSGNKNITKSISLYDFHLTYDYNVKININQKYNIPCYILPFGFDDNNPFFTTNINNFEKNNEILKLCFLGNPDKERVKFIKDVLSKNFKIDVYGYNWNKFIKHKNLKIFDPVYGNSFFEVLQKYRIQINIMREHNRNTHNMRSFDIPGAGGIMLAPNTPDHKIYFEDNKEIFLYDDINDFTYKANNLLQQNFETINNYRIAARQKSLQYTYTKISKYISDLFIKYAI